MLKPKDKGVDLLTLMRMPRHERRRIAKLNGVPKIAGIQDEAKVSKKNVVPNT